MEVKVKELTHQQMNIPNNAENHMMTFLTRPIRTSMNFNKVKLLVSFECIRKK